MWWENQTSWVFLSKCHHRISLPTEPWLGDVSFETLEQCPTPAKREECCVDATSLEVLTDRLDGPGQLELMGTSSPWRGMEVGDLWGPSPKLFYDFVKRILWAVRSEQKHMAFELQFTQQIMVTAWISCIFSDLNWYVLQRSQSIFHGTEGSFFPESCILEVRPITCLPSFCSPHKHKVPAMWQLFCTK